jgi:hypothetical protein
METINLVIIVVGAIISLIGIATFLNPNFAKLINVPGGPRLKAMVTLVVGLIILIYGLIR